ncbi:MAG: glycosyltransferase [Acidobacteria bacterium]|nr:glycosyltransferase [Acidobacteriota bacterium]
MDSPPVDGSKGQPWISVIVPARNEAANIGDCLRTLLKQGEEVEVLVADDGSEDSTAAIARELAKDAPHLRLLSVPPLPEGWMGKNHALHIAVPLSKGAWILFTDADTRHAEGALRGLVNWAEKVKLDLVSCSPPQQTETWWEKAVIPQVFRLLARLYPFERVNDPADPLAAANGQFLLIRREAYLRLGGHEAVRGEPLEDVALARRAKQAGCRIWFGPGDGIVSTRMYRTFSALWEGWTKNLFLLLGRDSKALRRTAAEWALRYWLPPVAGVLLVAAGFPAGWLGLAALAYSIGEHIRYARVLTGPERLRTTLLLAPGAFVVFLLLLNSQRRYSRKIGIKWKGRRYPAGNR